MLMLLLLGWSCSTDTGNYSYNDINELHATGIEENYIAKTGENFTIKPDLNATLDDGSNPSRYTYEWAAIDATKLPLERKTVIATTKDLTGRVNLPPATYTVYFFVKDNVTGVTWQTPSFELKVVSTISEGWLVIGDVSGEARLDMVSMDPTLANPVITDVLGAAGSTLKLKGKAVDITCFKNPILSPLMLGIYVTASESGTARIEQNTFAWKQTQNISYETIGPDFTTNFAIDFMRPISSGGGDAFIYSKGNIYYSYRVTPVKYSLPQNKFANELKPFVAAPFIAYNAGWYIGNPVFYDQVGHRFASFNKNTGTCGDLPTGKYLDFKNTDSDLVYMATTNYNRGENIAVLKNITTGKYNLLTFDDYLDQYYYREILNAPEFDKATKFAVSPSDGYLFYAVGGKVYEYDKGTQSAKLMIDKGSEEITFIGFNPNAPGNPNTPNRLVDISQKLIVGSYNGSVGTLELFTIPPVNGDLVLAKSYSGFGKIVDVDYRYR